MKNEEQAAGRPSRFLILHSSFEILHSPFGIRHFFIRPLERQSLPAAEKDTRRKTNHAYTSTGSDTANITTPFAGVIAILRPMRFVATTVSRAPWRKAAGQTLAPA